LIKKSRGANADPDSVDTTSPLTTLTLLTGVLALWALTHHYAGLAEDGELYAFQAMARLRPYLASDIYLNSTSQDAYTVFSPLYAAVIRLLGLRVASTLLFALFTACFYSAAWFMVRRLLGSRCAWLSLAMLICATLPYGGYGIFKVPQDYLTARSLAEALVVLSLAAHVCGNKRLAAAAIFVALLFHPLMAMPGLLLLLCVSVSTGAAVTAACIGTAGVAIVAAAAGHDYVSWKFLRVMDPNWLDVAHERSQFLFLNLWHRTDWEEQLRPFVSLLLSFALLDSAPIRKLCSCAALVGAAGLGIAAIAGAIGPVAVFVQGQGWRWVWVTSLIAVLLLAPTALRSWRAGGCGYLCAVLLVLSWTFPPGNGTLMIGAALLLWALRSQIRPERDRWLQAAAWFLIVTAAAWTLSKVWLTLPSQPPVSFAAGVSLLRDLFTSRILGLAVFGLSVFAIFRWPRALIPTLILAFVLFVAVLPGSLVENGGFNALIERRQFADWQAAIPDTSTVMVLPAPKTANFAWFTLERPSYLTLSQSAGVIFSSATATEVRRRSEVLLPVTPPDWKILSRFRQLARGEVSKDKRLPLTADNLTAICSDAQLGFVVARENLGFGALRHVQGGAWKDWNLYDCRRVRAAHEVI
jgi:hypothetical protein